MSLPQNLDSINLAILRLILSKPTITTREIQSIVFLSRVQVLRRLKQLEERGLVIKTNGQPGKTYRYTVNTAALFEVNPNVDPVAREGLLVILEGLRAINIQIAKMSATLENFLK